MAPVGGVVEISSDEEYFPTGTKLPVEPLGWASDLFDLDGQDDAIRDDFDDLIVMSEWSSPPVLQKTTKPDDIVVMNELSSPAVQQKKAKSSGGRDEENQDDFEDLTDDDDCMVLDGDPDKAVTVGEEVSAGDSSSDELQIVAEKGQVACRDFPHSRHLCASFPFKSTSHVKYCNMCHCFVCDTPAPCEYWGNGTSVTEHCHATDKVGQWNELRQAFKCKSLPSSGLEKHQSVPCSTMMSPRQQNMHFQVDVPQSLQSLAPSMRHNSLSNQNPLVYDVSQNQQMNPSVRVSLCLAGSVGTHRAGRGTGNPHIPQNTHSRAVFKRGGSFPQSANRFGSAATDQALRNLSLPFQVAPRTNAFTGTAQDNAPLRSFSAPIAFQAQQGQPAAYGQVDPNAKNVTGQQLSRCTSLTAQRTQCLEEQVIDVSTKSWEDILACVASDLGVPDYNISTTESQQITANISTAESQQITANISTAESQQISAPVHLTASPGLVLQHEPVAATDNSTSSDVHGLLNLTTGCNVQSDGPLQTAEIMDHLNCQSNIALNEAHVNHFACDPADDLAIDAARQLEISGLESNIMFEFHWG